MNAGPKTLAALKMLAAGREIRHVQELTSFTSEEVRAIADANGYPDLDKLAKAVNDLNVSLAQRDALPTRDHPVPPRPSPPPAPARPAEAPAAGGALNGGARPTPPQDAITVDALARACGRSEHKRTQNLGTKLTELAEKITAALRGEREIAEAKAKRDQERAAALAEIKRLEKALAEARAKATAAGAPGGIRGGARTCEVCGDQLANPQALGAHKRHKHGIRSSNPKTRSASA